MTLGSSYVETSFIIRSFTHCLKEGPTVFLYVLRSIIDTFDFRQNISTDESLYDWFAEFKNA